MHPTQAGCNHCEDNMTEAEQLARSLQPHPSVQGHHHILGTPVFRRYVDVGEFRLLVDQLFVKRTHIRRA